jgi:hypothetical protein
MFVFVLALMAGAIRINRVVELGLEEEEEEAVEEIEIWTLLAAAMMAVAAPIE